MKIKTESTGERLIQHCSWKTSPNCPDLKTTPEDLKKAALAFNIEKITSGCCESCEAILDAELDELEKINS